MNENNCEISASVSIQEKILKFREQALCIKTNVQLLKDLWNLQPQFKEKNVKVFYQIIQENCIFRMVLETYKLLLDSKNGSVTIREMANSCFREMKELEGFCARQQELFDMKRKFSSDLGNFADVEEIIKANRNRVYAHNDQKYHWFSESYIEFCGLTDEIYDRILDISNICINYCNELLKFFHKKPVYEYSNHDDVKRLFGMQTDRDKEIESFRHLIYGES